MTKEQSELLIKEYKEKLQKDIDCILEIYGRGHGLKVGTKISFESIQVYHTYHIEGEVTEKWCYINSDNKIVITYVIKAIRARRKKDDIVNNWHEWDAPITLFEGHTLYKILP